VVVAGAAEPVPYPSTLPDTGAPAGPDAGAPAGCWVPACLPAVRRRSRRAGRERAQQVCWTCPVSAAGPMPRVVGARALRDMGWLSKSERDALIDARPPPGSRPVVGLGRPGPRRGLTRNGD